MCCSDRSQSVCVFKFIQARPKPENAGVLLSCFEDFLSEWVKGYSGGRKRWKDRGGNFFDFKEASERRARDQFAHLLVSFLRLCLVRPRLSADRAACVCGHVPADIKSRSMKAVLVWFCLKNLPSGLKMDVDMHAHTHTRSAAQHSKKSNDAFRNDEITY